MYWFIWSIIYNICIFFDLFCAVPVFLAPTIKIPLALWWDSVLLHGCVAPSYPKPTVVLSLRVFQAILKYESDSCTIFVPSADLTPNGGLIRESSNMVSIQLTEGQVEVVYLGRCISSPNADSPPLLGFLAAADAGAFGLWPSGIEAKSIVGGCESFRRSSAQRLWPPMRTVDRMMWSSCRFLQEPFGSCRRLKS